MDRLGISINAMNRALAARYVAAGFSDAEIQLPASFLTEPGKLREYAEETVRIVRDGGLNIWSVHLPFGGEVDVSETDPEKRRQICDVLAPWLEAAQAWGASVAVIHGSSEPIEPEQRLARMVAAAESLSALRRVAGDVRLALEDLPRTCLARDHEEILALCKNCDGICFDVNHLLTESHEEFLRATAPSIVTTHLSDYDGIDERHWLPGQGIVPWKTVRTMLLDAGYQGPFLFELRAEEAGRPYAPEVVAQAWRDVLR